VSRFAEHRQVVGSGAAGLVGAAGQAAMACCVSRGVRMWPATPSRVRPRGRSANQSIRRRSLKVSGEHRYVSRPTSQIENAHSNSIPAFRSSRSVVDWRIARLVDQAPYLLLRISENIDSLPPSLCVIFASFGIGWRVRFGHDVRCCADRVLVESETIFARVAHLRRAGSDCANEVKSLQIECRELQTHFFPYWDAHLYGYRIVSPPDTRVRARQMSNIGRPLRLWVTIYPLPRCRQKYGGQHE
jgi:hypothetical protein